jgi:hypothetical protein
MNNAFTVSTAQQYAKENNIEEWIKRYLTESEGPNSGLLSRIVERKGFWNGPIEVPTSSLVRCFIPAENRVSELAKGIKDPCSVAPLIIHSRIHKLEICGAQPHIVFSHQLEIADGNHRHAAFEKMQWATCWVLVELGTEHLE